MKIPHAKRPFWEVIPGSPFKSNDTWLSNVRSFLTQESTMTGLQKHTSVRPLAKGSHNCGSGEALAPFLWIARRVSHGVDCNSRFRITHKRPRMESVVSRISDNSHERKGTFRDGGGCRPYTHRPNSRTPLPARFFNARHKLPQYRVRLLAQ